MSFAEWLDIVAGWVWGPWMIVFLVGTGLFLTGKLRFIQFRGLLHGLKCISGAHDHPDEEGDIAAPVDLIFGLTNSEPL